MCDKFFESVGVSEHLFSSPLSVVHQIGEKVEGAFVSYCTLTQFFRKYSADADNARALLVLTHRSKHHWMSISAKLGINLGLLQEKGALTVIDLMKEVFDSLNLDLEGPKDSTGNNPMCLSTLFTRCEGIIQNFRKSCGSKRILVIVEDLTNFLECCETDREGKFQNCEKLVLEFILKLKALSILCLEEEKCSISVNSFVQSPETPSESPELVRFAKLVSGALSTVSFEVSPLSTGYSSQVTGYLKVAYSPNNVPCNARKAENAFIRNFHFKLESNTVRVIPL